MFNNKVVIDLQRSTGDAVHMPEMFTKAVENEYAAKYLEMMGARPTKENVNRIIRQFPLSEAFVYPNWMNDTLVVIPGMADYIKSSNNQVVLKDGFGSVEDCLESYKQIKPVSRASTQKLSTAPIHQPKHLQPKIKVKRNLFPWSSAKSLNPGDTLSYHIEQELLSSEDFRKLLYPPHISSHLIVKPLHRFVANMATYFPKIKEFPSRSRFDTITTIIFSPSCMQVYSLLAQFCYWHILHPLVRRTLLKIRHNRIQGLESSSESICQSDDMMDYTCNSQDDDELSLVELAQQLSMDHKKHLHHGKQFITSQHLHAHSNVIPAMLKIEGAPVPDAGHDDCNVNIIPDKHHDGSNSLSYPDYVDADNQTCSASSLRSDSSLSAMEHEKVFMQIMRSLDRIKSDISASQDFTAINMVQQAFICCCHCIVDSILLNLYPWLDSKINDDFMQTVVPPASSYYEDIMSLAESQDQQSSSSSSTSHEIMSQMKLEIRRLYHQALADLLDPSRMMTSTMLDKAYHDDRISSFMKTSAKDAKLKYYATSTAVKAALGTSSSADVNRIMRQGIKPYIAVPGYVHKTITPIVSKLSTNNSAEFDMNNKLYDDRYSMSNNSRPITTFTSSMKGHPYNERAASPTSQDLILELRRRRNISRKDRHNNTSSLPTTSKLPSIIAKNASAAINRSNITIDGNHDLIRTASHSATIGSNEYYPHKHSSQRDLGWTNNRPTTSSYKQQRTSSVMMQNDRPEMPLAADNKAVLLKMLSTKISSEYKSGQIAQGKMTNPASRQNLIL